MTEDNPEFKDFGPEDLKKDQEQGIRTLETLTSLLVKFKITARMIGKEFKKLLRETKAKSDLIDEE